MRKLVVAVIVLAVVLVSGAGVASAAGLTEGGMGISVGMGNSLTGDLGVTRITGKYFIGRDLALLAGAGFQTSSGDYDANFFGFQVGIRKYLGTGEFATFVDGKLTYESLELNAPGFTAEDTDTIDLAAEFGAEYFFSKQFSVEGAVGVGFGTVDYNNNNTDYTYMGTRTVGVAANFYF